MPRSNSGRLPGGRAAYRGPDAYASQGFENDTRIRQLAGLLIAHLWGDIVIPASSVPVTIIFPTTYASKTMPSLVFKRGFAYDTATGIFTVLTPGTYRFSYSVRIPDLAAAALGAVELVLTRGLNQTIYTTALTNTGTIAGNFQPDFSDYVDLQAGDRFFLRVFQSGAGTATIRGGSTGTTTGGGVLETIRASYLVFEQIDVQ